MGGRRARRSVSLARRGRPGSQRPWGGERRRRIGALPGGSTPVNRILLARGLRGSADGFISVMLARYLTNLGFSPLEVGAIVTGTLLGSALLTIAFGFSPNRVPLRSLL